MKPGVYPSLSNSDYHGGPGDSKSGLDLIARSPLHFKAARDAANDNEPTAAQAFGSDFHEFLLEPDSFDETHVLPFVPPEGALATIDDIKAVLKDVGEKLTGVKAELIQRLKAIRPDALILDELKQQYAITNAGRKILHPDDWEKLRAMREAVLAHPAAASLLKMAGGVAEHSVYWVDKKTGMLCRCRPDWWIKPRGIIVDVKTTDDASPEGFAKSIADWRYHVQHAFYIDGINEMRRQVVIDNEAHEFAEAVPPEVRAFVFLAVEKKAPHAVGVYTLDNEAVALGRALYRRDLDTLAHCRATDTWPGYGDAIQSINVPAWEYTANANLLANTAA